ncbi:MAG: NAD(P)H-hydrate dehydratase [Halieaceae bacterium]|nr:NAD(P)H-hydrate dehydratase [Halieaceae bacterium]
MQLYTAAQTRELDRLAIEEYGIPGIHLMSRAGQAAFLSLLQQWPQPERLHIFCGTGNNAGDGFVVAQLAQARGLPVTIYQLGDAGRIKGDALLARRFAERAGVEITPWNHTPELERGVIVDGLLGTGFSGEPSPPYAAAIAAIGASNLPVLALDIPSGLCADSGAVTGAAVRADRSVTFIARKRGMWTGAGPEYCGQIEYCDLEIPAEIFSRVKSQSALLSLEALLAELPRRRRDAHKGQFGSVLVIGGDTGMGGAVLMAAEASARCGAGLVSAATRRQHVSALLARRPEVMARGVRNGRGLKQMLEAASVVVAGPGLGQSPWSEQLLHAAVASGKPLVVDADALNLLAQGRVAPNTRRDNWILSPHPGEAARLLGSDVASVQLDRFGAITELQQRYGGVVVLKGAGSLIAGPDGQILLSRYGNPGMASGGMGDVLSGVLAGLLAQHLKPLTAACLGVCLHGRAAEMAASRGERGLLATDLMEPLQNLLN